MLQDIAPYKLDNHYDPEKRPDENSFIIAFRGSLREREILIKTGSEEGSFLIPRLSDFAHADDNKSISCEIGTDNLVYAFSIDEERFFLSIDQELTSDCFADEGGKGTLVYRKFLELRKENLKPRHYVFAIYTAFHLYEWYDTSRFCGKCGSSNKHDDNERALVCPKCGNRIYPRINPAVIIGVTDKETNKLILTKYRTGFGQNALVAGFTEIGETLEETVKREVMEEVGLEVTNIRYYKSQPWGMASDILSGFYCDVAGDKEIRMDESELKYAEWVSPEDIVLQVPDYSLTNEMMRVYKEKGYAGTV